MATTPPMKNPTAMELWNLRIIMVPPIESAISIIPDQKDANPSANCRDPKTKKLIKANINVITKMEYLQ